MEAYWVDVRRPIEFLSAVLEAFCGQARLSLEGDLEALRGVSLPGASRDETSCLRRNTIWPKQDFIVVPLVREILPTLVALCSRLGLRRRVLHVQIEDGGALVFGAYDQFDPSCVWVSARFGESELQRLVQHGVIASYAQSQVAG
jgi:hypothetical protein